MFRQYSLYSDQGNGLGTWDCSEEGSVGVAGSDGRSPLWWAEGELGVITWSPEGSCVIFVASPSQSEYGRRCPSEPLEQSSPEKKIYIYIFHNNLPLHGYKVSREINEAFIKSNYF